MNKLLKTLYKWILSQIVGLNPFSHNKGLLHFPFSNHSVGQALTYPEMLFMTWTAVYDTLVLFLGF